MSIRACQSKYGSGSSFENSRPGRIRRFPGGHLEGDFGEYHPRIARRGRPGTSLVRQEPHHPLSRGGDRSANNASHQVALVRMASCQRTKDYLAKRTFGGGNGKREIMRCLRRCAAREIFRQITNPRPAPNNSDLRRMRTELGSLSRP